MIRGWNHAYTSASKTDILLFLELMRLICVILNCICLNKIGIYFFGGRSMLSGANDERAAIITKCNTALCKDNHSSNILHFKRSL